MFWSILDQFHVFLPTFTPFLRTRSRGEYLSSGPCSTVPRRKFAFRTVLYGPEKKICPLDHAPRSRGNTEKFIYLCFSVDWRILVKERIANIGVFGFLLFQ